MNGVMLGKHQLKAIEELRKGKILCGGVGSGKSRTAIAYYYTKACGGGLPINGKGEWRKMEKPMNLYVITTAKKRDTLDWLKEAVEFGISTDRKDNPNGICIIIDSWNNISKYKDRVGCFFIFDEQRVVGSGAWVKSFLDIARKNHWILLSATPGDTWLDYIPVFVANGFYPNRTEFKRQHVVYNHFSKFPKVDHYVGTAHLNALRRRVLVDMPMARGTIRHDIGRSVGYDVDIFNSVYKDRWHPYEDRPIKDVSEWFAMMRRITNMCADRIDVICELFEKHPKLIIFYNFDYELDMLRDLGAILDVPLTEWNGHKHEQIPSGDRWIYLVQYMAGSEAWECIETDTIVFYSMNYSWRIMEQCRGRIDRLNTTYVDLFYYTLRSSSFIDLAILKALRAKKEFNERESELGREWAKTGNKSGHTEYVEISG